MNRVLPIENKQVVQNTTLTLAHHPQFNYLNQFITMKSSYTAGRQVTGKITSQPTPPMPQYPTKPTSSTGFKTQNLMPSKQNVALNAKVPVGGRTSATGIGMTKSIEAKVAPKKEPVKMEPYPVYESKEVKKPVRPMSSKGTSNTGATSFRPPMVVDQRLQACRECGRNFNEKALAKHQKICKKVFSQKRKVFNSAKQRIVSKQQVQIAKKATTQHKYQSQQSQPTSGIPKWKQDSLAFRIAMKQAKGIAPTPQQARIAQQAQQESSNLKLCKFCGRKFNKETAQRHIPFCEKKTKEANLRKPTGKR